MKKLIDKDEKTKYIEQIKHVEREELRSSASESVRLVRARGREAQQVAPEWIAWKKSVRQYG